MPVSSLFTFSLFHDQATYEMSKEFSLFLSSVHARPPVTGDLLEDEMSLRGAREEVLTAHPVAFFSGMEPAVSMLTGQIRSNPYKTQRSRFAAGCTGSSKNQSTWWQLSHLAIFDYPSDRSSSSCINLSDKRRCDELAYWLLNFPQVCCWCPMVLFQYLLPWHGLIIP